VSLASAQEKEPNLKGKLIGKKYPEPWYFFPSQIQFSGLFSRHFLIHSLERA
jgi:hypothetical protein